MPRGHCLVSALLFALAMPVLADAPEIAQAAALRANYAASQAALGRNAFHRPLTLQSREGKGAVSGDIHALLDASFETAGAELASPEAWCGIMVLHINTKGCQVSAGTAGKMLGLWIGAKEFAPLAEASRLSLAFRVYANTPGYLRVGLSAAEGPMGTRDYRILLEAIPLADGRTFLHLAYSYGYGVFGEITMQAYLATAGRDKVGFTVLKPRPGDPAGSTQYIAGLRGVTERNTMRYYLAIEAYLGALSVAPGARFEKRIRDWYAAAENFPRQLHEIDQAEYLDMKRRQNLRPLLPPA